MTGQSPAQRQATAIAAVVILAIAFAANFFFNHTPKGAGVKAIPGFYPIVFFIGWGTLVPAWLMGMITLGGIVTPRDLGIGAGRRDAFAALLALVIGASLAFFPLVPLLRDAAGLQTVHGVFAGLIVASAAEVLLFLGVLDAGVQALFLRDDWKAKATTVVVSSIAFGLFHFTYPEPWNTLSTAAMLGGIWLLTSLLFVLSRSLLAAILFDNLMATTGFVKNSLTLPLPAIYGWLLAALALATFILVFGFARR